MKLHDRTSLKLGNLAILSGVNGMGKSSIIQSLLLLRQTYLSGIIESGLNLKGDLCYVGTANEMSCQSSSEDAFHIDIDFGDLKLQQSFEYPKGEFETFLKASPDNHKISEKTQKEGLFSRNFQYLSAFRFGPQKAYERDTLLVQEQGQISKEMGRGEYVIHFLHHFSNKRIPIETLGIGGLDYPTDYFLKEQVERWLKEITPNIRIDIESFSEEFRLKYKYEREKNLMTSSVTALNTGFGVTYILPILVAVLSAQPGSLIIIENPEAHIHPSGQAALMNLLTKASKAGVQIVLETHSDHIINGSLVSIKNAIINHNELSIHFFERDEQHHTAIVHELEIRPSGKIVKAPKGFFDQFEKDLTVLTGF